MWIDDDLLKEARQSLVVKCFVPPEPLVVLGRSNSENECRREVCALDGVPILQRLGGGGAVVLHPGCVVLSVGTWVKDFFSNGKYFKQLNDALMESLKKLSGNSELPLFQRGFSDICFGEKKFVGTSLFRSRNYLLYQASLIVDLRIDLIEKYLPHPSKEPDYRKKKSHREFLTSWQEIIGRSDVSPQGLKDVLYETFQDRLLCTLKDEAIDPVNEQVQHLLTKIE